METNKKQNDGKKPIAHMRAGSVSASVWSNKGKGVDGKDKDFVNITFQRSYKDDKTGEFKNVDSYGAGDLLKLQALCLAAYIKYGINETE